MADGMGCLCGARSSDECGCPSRLHVDWTPQIVYDLKDQIAELEAEAKAVRSKTIEECAKVALDYAYQTVEFDEHEWKCEINGTIYFSPRPFGQDIAGAIRALNSGKD